MIIQQTPQTMLSRPAQWLLGLGFVVLLALPSADWAFGIDPSPPPEEYRMLAPQPDWPQTLAGWAGWPALYEAFFKDHFGLRNTLIAWHSLLMLDALGVSPNKDVLIGKDDWLFLGAEKNVNAYRCLYPYTPQELQILQGELDRKYQWLRQRGIAYLNIWVPIKANIYPEFLPPTLKKLKQPCRMKQWVAHMQKHSQAPVIDLSEAILAAKKKSPKELLYFKTDTHWNPRGAWTGYQALVPLLRKLVPKAAVIAPDRVTFDMRSTAGGDLARMIDQPERYRVQAPVEQIKATGIRNVPAPVDRGPNIHVLAFECATCGPAKAVMIHDSFGNHLRTFLAESFARIVSVEFGPFDEKLIEQEKPDIVFEVHLERQLMP